MPNNQRAHFWVLLGLTMFFYLASAVSSLLFARHWVATDFLNPTAGTYFQSLMLATMVTLDPRGYQASSGSSGSVPPANPPSPLLEG